MVRCPKCGEEMVERPTSEIQQYRGIKDVGMLDAQYFRCEFCHECRTPFAYVIVAKTGDVYLFAAEEYGLWSKVSLTIGEDGELHGKLGKTEGTD